MEGLQHEPNCFITQVYYSSRFLIGTRQLESKEIFVKAHTRVMKQRVYRFVCKDCNSTVERTCYPSQPLYCLECRPPKSKTSKFNKKAVAKSKKKYTAEQPVAEDFIVETEATQKTRMPHTAKR